MQPCFITQRTLSTRLIKIELVFISSLNNWCIDRRKVLKNDEEYVMMVLKHLDEFDTTVDNAQLEILKKIGMTLDDFSKNIEFYFTNGNQDIYIMTTQVPQKLK